MTEGTFFSHLYRDDLLYRHFLYLEALSDAAVLHSQTLVSGNPDVLFGGQAPAPEDLTLVLTMAVRNAWSSVERVPVVFDPYAALSPTIESFEAKDGWLNIYERYALATLAT